MSSLAELRAAIAGAVHGKGDPPLHGYAYSPSDVITPAAVVEPEEVDWDAAPATFRRGNEEWEFSVFVLIAPTDAAGADAQRDAFFDRSSNDLRDAIEEADSALKVAGADRWGAFALAGREFAGFRLRVIANN